MVVHRDRRNCLLPVLLHTPNRNKVNNYKYNIGPLKHQKQHKNWPSCILLFHKYHAVQEQYTRWFQASTVTGLDSGMYWQLQVLYCGMYWQWQVLNSDMHWQWPVLDSDMSVLTMKCRYWQWHVGTDSDMSVLTVTCQYWQWHVGTDSDMSVLTVTCRYWQWQVPD